MLIAVHCEDETTIRNNLAQYKELYGEDIPVSAHHLIEVKKCVTFPLQKKVALAKKQVLDCIFHLSTAKEMELFTNKISVRRQENYCRSLYSSFMVYQ
jgi:dihydroorotase